MPQIYPPTDRPAAVRQRRREREREDKFKKVFRQERGLAGGGGGGGGKRKGGGFFLA